MVDGFLNKVIEKSRERRILIDECFYTYLVIDDFLEFIDLIYEKNLGLLFINLVPDLVYFYNKDIVVLKIKEGD